LAQVPVEHASVPPALAVPVIAGAAMSTGLATTTV
jgi:hypothetical protein